MITFVTILNNPTINVEEVEKLLKKLKINKLQTFKYKLIHLLITCPKHYLI